VSWGHTLVLSVGPVVRAGPSGVGGTHSPSLVARQCACHARSRGRSNSGKCRAPPRHGQIYGSRSRTAPTRGIRYGVLVPPRPLAAAGGPSAAEAAGCRLQGSGCPWGGSVVAAVVRRACIRNAARVAKHLTQPIRRDYVSVGGDWIYLNLETGPVRSHAASN
jgi:hypothetical protein